MVFTTYALSKKSPFSFSKILNLLIILNAVLLITMYIVALFPQFFRYKDKILESTFGVIISLISLFLVRVLHYIFFKSKKKKPVGTLNLTAETIELNDQKMNISEVKHLRFVGNDVLGDFRGFASKGTENQVFIELNSGEKFTSYFLQTQEINLKAEKDLLEHYQKLGILSEANFENIMNNTNYY